MASIVQGAGLDAAATVPYDLAYIEFDDEGEYWTIGNLKTRSDANNSQVEAAVRLIKKRDQAIPTKPLVVITFIHGWKNNASPYDEEHKNLFGFKQQLLKLSSQDRHHSYIGIFIAWRGQSVTNDLFATYWNRRGAARRVGGASMTEALFRLMFVVKPPIPPTPTEESRCGSPGGQGGSGQDKNIFVIIGHSFGVRVLERAISQPILALLYERRSEAGLCRIAWDRAHPMDHLQILTFDRPADLIVMINAANDAFEAKAMIEGMQRMNLRSCVGLSCDGRGEFFDSAPMIVSILSDGDWITRKLMPVAQAVSYPSQNLSRKYDTDQEARREGQITGVKQRSFFFHNEGSIEPLISHTVVQCGGNLTPCDFCHSILHFAADDGSSFALRPVWVDTSKCVNIPLERLSEASGSGDQTEDILSKPSFINRTPFWVFAVPKSVIPNHSDLFTAGTSNLLTQLLKIEAESNRKMSVTTNNE